MMVALDLLEIEFMGLAMVLAKIWNLSLTVICSR